MESSAIWLVVVMSIVGANLPFFSDRHFLVVPMKRPKAWYHRLGEMAVLFFVVGGIARGLEARIGQVYPQHWEFYAVAAAMFLVLGFPGYVARYLVRRVAA